MANKYGNRILKRKQKKLVRTKQLLNLNNAKMVGVSFQITSEERFGKVKDFLKFLSSKSIHVVAFGYYNGKEIPEQYLMHQGINMISKKDLNWYGKPKTESAEEFVNASYDILVDLDFEQSFPIHWIVSLSKAKLKVGKKMQETEKYDFMIETKDDDIKYFCEQLTYYLEQIKIS